MAELATPALVTRFGYRATFAMGLLLLGAPALALVESCSLAVVLGVSLVRGLGFGVTVVAGGARVASLVPAERRPEYLVDLAHRLVVPGDDRSAVHNGVHEIGWVSDTARLLESSHLDVLAAIVA